MQKHTKHLPHTEGSQVPGNTVHVQNAVFGVGIQAPVRTSGSTSGKQKKSVVNATRGDLSGNPNNIKRTGNSITDLNGIKMSTGSTDKKSTMLHQKGTKSQGDPSENTTLSGKRGKLTIRVSVPIEKTRDENHTGSDQLKQDMGAIVTSVKDRKRIGAGKEEPKKNIGNDTLSSHGTSDSACSGSNGEYTSSTNTGHDPEHQSQSDPTPGTNEMYKHQTSGIKQGSILTKNETTSDDFEFPANFRADGRISGTKALKQPETRFSFKMDEFNDISNTTEDSSEQQTTSCVIDVFTSAESIVELTVDVIVSSEDSLLHGSGMIAKAISKKGGKALEVCKECIRQICSGVQQWKFQPTPSTGELKCKHIFHAVVPRFSAPNQIQWMEGFRVLISELLYRTECLGFESLALPVLGTGKNGAPTDFVTDILCEEIDKYVSKREKGTLNSIILVHPDKNVQHNLRMSVKNLKNVSSKNNFNPVKRTDILSTYTDFFVEIDGTEKESCPICMEEVEGKGLKKLSKCNHIFCENCLEECFKRAPVCPMCSMVYGPLTGSQPKGLMIELYNKDQHLPGYDNCGCIQILYSFPDGKQSDEHPHPGCMYKGTRRMAFLPDNKEGQKVHRLLRRAFEQRLVFTIGSSRTTGKDDVVTWNDIHHKTNIHGGSAKFGYPDPSYLSRVMEELGAKGITED